VSAEINNLAARAFYERFGFRLHREYARFLGDQIIRIVEYAAPIANLLDGIGLGTTIKKGTERT
jgi:catechol 2,3-dioxygenase-like lactoylglutathione lyase family enzyme